MPAARTRTLTLHASTVVCRLPAQQQQHHHMPHRGAQMLRRDEQIGLSSIRVAAGWRGSCIRRIVRPQGGRAHLGVGPSALLMKGSFLMASLCSRARSDSCITATPRVDAAAGRRPTADVKLYASLVRSQR